MEKRKRTVPRVAAIHDLSCYGRCALTVIIPALSACGFQAVPVPTALLSTHTGGFDNIHTVDLEQSIKAVGEHLASVGVSFDAIYTGYLGSARQADTVAEFIDLHKRRDTLLLVDPVMGDGGRLYSACTPELSGKMRGLCARADIITPNLTEACFLTDSEYPELSGATAQEATRCVDRISEKLSEFTDAVCIITGIHCLDGVGTYCAGRMHIERARTGDYPGTGDLFASVMLAVVLKSGGLHDRESVCKAAAYASGYTAEVIDYSLKYGADEPKRDGVIFEPCLGKLCRDVCDGGVL